MVFQLPFFQLLENKFDLTKIRTGSKFLSEIGTVRIFFYFENPYQYPDRTEVFYAKLVRSGFFYFEKKNPDHGPDHKKIRTGTDYPDQKIRTTDRTRENPDRNIRTTDRTKKIRTKKNPDHGPDRTIPDRRSGQP